MFIMGLMLFSLKDTSMKKIPYKLKPFAEQDLQKALDFTDKDLQANRDGYMSKRQRKVLLRRFWKYIRYILISSVGFLVFCIVCIFVFDNGIVRAGVFIFGILPILIAVGLGFVWANSQFRAIQADLRKGNVETISGQASKRSVYVMVIESIRFEMHEDIGVLFQDGAGYVVHYAPHSKRILSAEKLNPYDK